MSRKQRRAQENALKQSTVQSAADIPYARPTDTSKPKPSKTLLDIAAEKQAQLVPGSKLDPKNIANVTVDNDGKVVPLPGSSIENLEDPSTIEISPWLDTLFLSISLSLIHFTLSTLTMHQYAQSLEFPPLIRTTLFTAFPTLFLIVHLFHGHLLPISTTNLSSRRKSFLNILRQGVLLALANVSGCYLIYLTNDKGYYAVMKNAPGVGTLWVFAVLELGLVGALLGVVGPGIYAWWHGYGVL